MKKITLLVALMISSLGFAQQQAYNLDFESGTPSGIATNWFTFDNSPAPAVIITNPDPDGVNTSATTKVLKVVVGPGNAFYAGVNNRWEDQKFGTWKIDAAVPSNMTVSIDVNKNYVGTVGIKMGTKTGATTFQITNQNVGNAIVNQWQTLTWTIPSIPATLETDVDQIVVFVDWTQGQPDRAENSTILIDNIRFNAQKLTDPAVVVPTCSDGIQNGDETGVDCGGTTCSPCIAAAPVPVIPESEVISVYSDTYTTNKVGNFNFNAFQGTGVISEVLLGGNKTGKIAGLQYYGAQWDAVDINAYSYVHIDYYVTSSTNFNLFLIDKTAGIPGGNPAEPKYSFGGSSPDAPIVTGSWQSVFIPLSHFKNFNAGTFSYDLNDIFQYKFDGNGDLYFDNIYFSKTNSLGTASFAKSNIKMYPNPVKNFLNIEANSSIDNVTVYNILGQEVMKVSPKSNSATLQTADLQKGVYMITTDIEGNISTSKFVKE